MKVYKVPVKEHAGIKVIYYSLIYKLQLLWHVFLVITIARTRFEPPTWWVSVLTPELPTHVRYEWRCTNLHSHVTRVGYDSAIMLWNIN